MKQAARLLFVSLLVSLLFSECSLLDEQSGIIYGTVTDFVTGQPLNNVNVKLRPTGETTLTGMDGTYQFNDVKKGDYTLSLSKNGYSDLDDDYTITVAAGSNVRRDVQLRALFQSLRISVDGRETDTLDFGVDPSVERMNYTIENNGTASFEANIQTSSNWITLDRYYTYELEPNMGETHYLRVERDQLNIGENIGYLYISSGNYTKTVVVRAVGLGMPVVTNPVLSNITAHTCDAQSSVTDNGGWSISDKGFEYCASNSHYPDAISCGPGESNFQTQIPKGTGETYSYRIRAYATNGVYTGYSGWVYINQ